VPRSKSQSSYNGFGGKVEPGETSLQAAKRELQVRVLFKRRPILLNRHRKRLA
jgi:ADP-ribose pyrophosphatase YjhB (NUDIX family)